MSGLLAASDAAHSITHLHGEGVFNYWLIVCLMMTGIYLVLSRSNMVKTIIGLNLFQVSTIMFYVSMGKVEDGTAPILMGEDVVVESHDSHGEEPHNHDDSHGNLRTTDMNVLVSTDGPGNASLHINLGDRKPQIVQTHMHSTASGHLYSNPLPHVLMLTAIVVGIATTALALSLVVRINEAYGTIEEDEIDALEVQV